jgi:hypothetical protein
MAFVGLVFMVTKTQSCIPVASDLISVTYKSQGGSSQDTLYLQPIKEDKLDQVGQLGRNLDPIPINYLESSGGGSSRDTLQVAMLETPTGQTKTDTIYFLPGKQDTLFFLAIKKDKLRKSRRLRSN